MNLLNPLSEITQWEVDFVLQSGTKTIGIDVKSGRARESLPGIEKFRQDFNPDRILLVGDQGIEAEKFLMTPIENLFQD